MPMRSLDERKGRPMTETEMADFKAAKRQESLPRLAARAGMLGRYDLLDGGTAEVMRERIIGAANDMLHTEFLYSGSDAASSVGRITVWDPQNNGWYGTGMFIAPDLILTNNHVFPLRDHGGSIELGYQMANGRQLLPHTKVTIDPQKFFCTSAKLDYTIVATRTPAKYFTPLLPQSGKALIEERINIIQHPGGGPQRVSIRQNKLVARGEHRLYYTSDTEPGSSGSPLFNDQWQVVGIHHSGTKDANIGTRISYVVCDAIGKLQGESLDKFMSALRLPQQPV